MKNVWKSLTALVGVTALSLSAAMAQDSGALVDALVKKGVLTDQEAEDIRADLTKEYATSSAGKLQISSFVTSLKLYGDVRYRYELDSRKVDTSSYGLLGPVSNPGTAYTSNRIRNRNRIRVRIGGEFAFTDNFKAGIRLATGTGGNTTNADLGQPGAVSSAGAYSSSTLDNIHLDLAYLEYDKAFGLDWLSLTAGKQLFGQNLVQGVDWDSDINPEGGLIKVGDFKFGDFSVGGTSGVYIYGDTIDSNWKTPALGDVSQSADDTWQLINQIDFKYKFSKDISARLSPGFMNYAGATNTAAAAGTLPLTNGGAAYDVRDLNIFFVNAELTHPLWWDWKNKIYGDYAVNLSGRSRARAETLVGPAGSATDGVSDNGRNQLATVGMTQSKGKGKGAWSLDEQFIYQEAYSWDPNLNDSDWNGGYLNGVGFSLATTYNFTDFLSTTVRYRHSTDIDHDQMARASLPLGDTPTGGPGTGAIETRTDLVQVDLTWKF